VSRAVLTGLLWGLSLFAIIQIAGMVGDLVQFAERAAAHLEEH
jgi:predicted cobalt transporter CbtA